MKQEAKVLVECMYAMYLNDDGKTLSRERGSGMNYNHWTEPCNPYTDTLDGRRQADAIEDWLITANGYNYNKQGELLWDESMKHVDTNLEPHKLQVRRIQWCMKQRGI